MITPRVGLLPLYLELYDRCNPEARQPLECFLSNISQALQQRGVEVCTGSVCRIESEFADMVNKFEATGVDAIVTLHLAYSPSLESSTVLSRTDLPILILDTTPDFSFGPKVDPAILMSNHGIHGVQDMCNLLRRNGKAFAIEAGHWLESDVLDRVVSWAKAAALRSAFRSSRIGRIGNPFVGMGDFAVPSDDLKKSYGIETIAISPADIASDSTATNSGRVHEEIVGLRDRYMAQNVADDALRDSVQASLATRDWISANSLTGFTMNFMEISASKALPVVPFLEASLAMSRGLGYAGEGDVLTAALCSALLSSFPNTTFSEMFCPDWKGNAIFLSHMGEVNPTTLCGKPKLLQKPFAYTDAGDPVSIVGCLKPGKAAWINLAPSGDTFRLLVIPVDVLDQDESEEFSNMVRGWMRTQLPVSRFLESYSRHGGTHHAALVYDADTNIVERFGKLMGWQVAGTDEWKG